MMRRIKIHFFNAFIIDLPVSIIQQCKYAYTPIRLKLLKEKTWGLAKLSLIETNPKTILMTLNKFPQKFAKFITGNDNFKLFSIGEIHKIINNYGGKPNDFFIEVL